ncbi:SRPBCC family protein [Amycolatopsis suaedae]|uniref:SRPBCC domain-containing protein n=1 Tax=Amycolatopsis suaedae TaxID=2510978 RepID=A0A4Q7J1H4_9PSEU|nr:SRPBCC domain-containing protein [Amycolatopsis suaedae]RZQ60578.1 SRPBCC domain-containing protein [Amycolatopsis suaedae]
MGHKFENTDEFTVDATPEQVWDAIATGPGITSWFMGRNEVSPGPGGSVSTLFGQYAPVQPITAWEPGKRLAYGEQPDEDGRFIAYEFLVEGRDSGSTVVRMVTSGFLPGDDWADEFDMMSKGGAMFFATLATYLRHYAGRRAAAFTAFGPPAPDWAATRDRLATALGLPGWPSAGDAVRFDAPEGPVEGTVYAVNDDTLGIRTPDAMYRFMKSFGPSILAMHLFYTDDHAGEPAWQQWLTTHLS